MGSLAQLRARACADALLSLGVGSDRLFVTHRGQGSRIGVSFIPRSMRPYAPMPPGDFGEFAVILQGETKEAGHVARLPLQACLLHAVPRSSATHELISQS